MLVTLVGMLVLPAALILSALAAARFSGTFASFQTGTIALALIGGAVVGLSTWLVRWLGAGWALVVFLPFYCSFVGTAGLLGGQRARLAGRGIEVFAVVVDRDEALRTRSYRCTLERLDGAPIRPELRGSEYYQLDDGRVERFVVDPEGEITPMPQDRFESHAEVTAIAVGLAVVYALIIPAAAVRGRAGQRRATAGAEVDAVEASDRFG